MSDATANPPAFLDLIPPAESEDHPPVAANFVNVSGDGDAFALDFYYLHPAKVTRIFEGGTITGEHTRVGDTVIYQTEPVARLLIPLTAATELVTELMDRIATGAPHLREMIDEFGEKLHRSGLTTSGRPGEENGRDRSGE